MKTFCSTVQNRSQILPWVLFCTCFLAACSGSSGTSNNVSNSASEGAQSSNNSALSATSSDNQNQNAGVPGADPLVQSRVAVKFDITVPVHYSDELRVKLDWGDEHLDAAWIGGQFWSASAQFPAESENQLTVTFYDYNGDIELAVVNQKYSTGSNDAEALQIEAEDFDADQFDTDGDGANNLNELIAGTDPLVDEQALLEVYDFYTMVDHRGRFARLSVSESFESRLSEARPYIDTFNTDPTWYTDVDGTVNIDADGNGTVGVNADIVPRRNLIILNGSRTSSVGGVTWIGQSRSWDSDYYHEENITNTVLKIDADTRSFAEARGGRNNGTYEFEWESAANFIGTLVEGTSLCKPTSGSFASTEYTHDPELSSVSTTVTKQSEDSYWRVVVTRKQADESEVQEYFVRELKLLDRADSPESALFHCDFVDF